MFCSYVAEPLRSVALEQLQGCTLSAVYLRLRYSVPPGLGYV